MVVGGRNDGAGIQRQQKAPTAGGGAVSRGSSSLIWRVLRDYAWRYRWSYFAGGLFLWVTNYLSVSIPVEIGKAIDGLRADKAVTGAIIAIAAMGLGVIVVRSLSRILIFNPGRDLEYRLREDLFDRLLALSPAYYAHHNRGDVVSRAVNDISWVRAMVGYGGLQVANVTIAVILTGWKMVALSPRLTVLTLLPVLLGVAVVQWGVRRLFELNRRNQEQLGAISDHVLGTLQGVATVQGFVAEEAFADRFSDRNREWFATSMRLAMVRSLAVPVLVLSGGVAVFALIAVGGPLVLSGGLTVGQLAAFAALLTVLLPPLRSLGWLLSVIQRGRAAMVRIFELMDAPPGNRQVDEPRVLEAGKGPEIALEGLTFAYPDRPGVPVLKDVTVRLPAGSTVGLFGRTGSGKTTLLRLLARLFEPPPGTVLVDGVDLTELELGPWRERITVVPQRPFLFSDTISFNIALDEDPDLERVRRAARLAALKRDLEVLPDGFDTVVGERGIMLSGGQRQRVALARGLYRGGDVLVLDDVLSAVDHRTEAELVETLSGLTREGRAPTVLIASHRLSALRHADLVLVLDRGRLVDHGRHDELVERPGIYRDTWRAQRAEEPLAAAAGRAQ